MKRVQVSFDLMWPDTSPPVAIGVRWLLKRFLRTYAARCLTVSIGPADLPMEPTDPQGRNDDQA